MILQQEPTECGLACLAIILEYFGSQIDLAVMRKQHDISVRGTSLGDLMRMAKAFNLEAMAYRIKPSQLTTLPLPAILFWDSTHYVVLTKINKRKGFLILDPAIGKYWISLEETQTHFSSFAITLKPGTNYQALNNMVPGTNKRILKEIPKFMNQSATVLLWALLLQLVILTFPLYAQKMISNDLNIIPIMLILFKCAEAALHLLRGLSIIKLEHSITKHLGKYVFKHLLNLPLSYFEKRSHHTIFSRFNSIDKIRETLSRGLAEGLIDGFFSVTILILLATYSVTIVALVMLITVIYLIIHYAMSQMAQTLNLHQINQRSKEATLFLESIRCIIPIKIASSENKILKKWEDQYDRFLKTSSTLKILQNTLEATRILLFGFVIVLCLYHVSNFYAVLFYLVIYTKNISSITNKWFDTKLCFTHLHYLNDILLQNIEPPKHRSSSAILLENVSFRYHKNSPWIIKNFTLTIIPGECIVLYGPSGCGKTTLLKILMGLTQPTSGNVFLNNHKIAAVMQNDELLKGSIYENISFFDETIDKEKAHRCAHLAEIHADIMRMPMSYHSYLGDTSSISGGQKQRLLLARALYQDPDLLFLDEAFSNLDIETEAKLNATLQGLNISRIIITHRKEMLNIADKIVEISPQLRINPSLPATTSIIFSQSILKATSL